MDAKLYYVVAKQIIEQALEHHIDLMRDDRGDQISVADIKAIELEHLGGPIEMIMENIRDELWLAMEDLKPVLSDITIKENEVKYSLGFQWSGQ